MLSLKSAVQKIKVNNKGWGEADRFGQKRGGKQSLLSQSLTHSGLLDTPCFLLITSAPGVYHPGDDSGFSITLAHFPSSCLITLLSASNVLFLLFKSFWRLARLLRWSWVRYAETKGWVVAQEGARCWALSDPVSHTCQFSRLAGP